MKDSWHLTHLKDRRRQGGREREKKKRERDWLTVWQHEGGVGPKRTLDYSAFKRLVWYALVFTNLHCYPVTHSMIHMFVTIRDDYLALSLPQPSFTLNKRCKLSSLPSFYLQQFEPSLGHYSTYKEDSEFIGFFTRKAGKIRNGRTWLFNAKCVFGNIIWDDWMIDFLKQLSKTNP